jgi:hypothetical protein
MTTPLEDQLYAALDEAMEWNWLDGDVPAEIENTCNAAGAMYEAARYRAAAPEPPHDEAIPAWAWRAAWRQRWDISGDQFYDVEQFARELAEKEKGT